MISELHKIKGAKGAKKKRKRVGRGNASGHGTYSTRGQKGQRSRSGVSGLKRLGFRDTLRRIPKKRGFKSQKPKYEAVNLAVLSEIFRDGEKVNPSILRKKGIVGNIGNMRGIKILGQGEIDKKLIFEDVVLSDSAAEKIKKAGGEILQPKK